MADITTLSKLISGLERQVDLTSNTPVVLSIKVGGGTNTELTKSTLDGLITLLNINPITTSITFGADGGGSVLTTGSKARTRIPFACTVTGWELVGDQTGSIVVDVKKASYSGLPSTTSIAGSQKPTLSGVQKNQSSSVSTWTTSISAGDWIEFNIDSISTLTRIDISITIVRT